MWPKRESAKLAAPNLKLYQRDYCSSILSAEGPLSSGNTFCPHLLPLLKLSVMSLSWLLQQTHWRRSRAESLNDAAGCLLLVPRYATWGLGCRPFNHQQASFAGAGNVVTLGSLILHLSLCCFVELNSCYQIAEKTFWENVVSQACVDMASQQQKKKKQFKYGLSELCVGVILSIVCSLTISLLCVLHTTISSEIHE